MAKVNSKKRENMAKVNNKERGNMAKENNDNNETRQITPEEVYENKSVIMGIASRLGWDRESQKDLVQEVAFKCWNDHRIAYNPAKGTITSFLKCIAWTTAIGIYRMNKIVLVPTEEIEITATIDAESCDNEDYEEKERQLKLLRKGYDVLCSRYPSKASNDAFLMFKRDGKHAKEIMKELGVDERFVNVAVHRGFERLREIVLKLDREEREQSSEDRPLTA